MIIEITLVSGTKTKLSEADYDELKRFMSQEQTQVIGIPWKNYPTLPTYPDAMPWKPMEVFYNTSGSEYSGTPEGTGSYSGTPRGKQ